MITIRFFVSVCLFFLFYLQQAIANEPGDSYLTLLNSLIAEGDKQQRDRNDMYHRAVYHGAVNPVASVFSGSSSKATIETYIPLGEHDLNLGANVVAHPEILNAGILLSPSAFSLFKAYRSHLMDQVRSAIRLSSEPSELHYQLFFTNQPLDIALDRQRIWHAAVAAARIDTGDAGRQGGSFELVIRNDLELQKRPRRVTHVHPHIHDVPLSMKGRDMSLDFAFMNSMGMPVRDPNQGYVANASRDGVYCQLSKGGVFFFSSNPTERYAPYPYQSHYLPSANVDAPPPSLSSWFNYVVGFFKRNEGSNTGCG